jgi:predicted HTH transcriptional regulator
MDKHSYRIQYLLNNDMTLKEAANHFGVAQSTMSSSLRALKTKDFNLYMKAKSHLAKNPAKRSKYLNVAMYIIENFATKEEAAEHFNTTVGYLDYAIYYYIKRRFPTLFTQVITILDLIRENDTKYMQMARYILKHKCSRKEVARHFNIKVDSISNYLDNIKNKNVNLYNQIVAILNQNKDRKYVKIAKYMIETGATYKEAGIHFGITEEAVHANINFLLKNYNPELFAQVKFIKEAQKVNRKLQVEHRNAQIITYILNNTCTRREISELFKVGASTISKIIGDVTDKNILEQIRFNLIRVNSKRD